MNPSHASYDVPQVQAFRLLLNMFLRREVRRLSTSCSAAVMQCALGYFMQFDLKPHQQIILFYFSLEAIVLTKFIHHAVFSVMAKNCYREHGKAVNHVQ